MDLHYGGGSVVRAARRTADHPAFEIEYAPYGVSSGLCVGVCSTAARATRWPSSRAACTSKTVWIVDALDPNFGAHSGFVPLINGSNTNFSHPFVLTYPKNGYPTDIPRPQLTSPT